MPGATPHQTIGPYWHLLEVPEWADLTRFGAAGERITLIGTITDGDGGPVADGCVELWQPSPPQDESFPGWGRCATDAEGNYRFTTLRPGPLPPVGGNARQAPHLAVMLHARGLLKPLATRAYFEGEPMNDEDPVLALVDDPRRRATLLARRVCEGTWRFDVNLQGDDETVFVEL